jgi:sugar O-acyltransferase (sialic acid O-acetyltransferase NeuD family)
MTPIVLIGASGHASVIADIIAHQRCYSISGVFDDNPYASDVLQHKVIGPVDSLSGYLAATDVWAGIIAIGDNFIRHRVVLRVLQAVPNFRFVTPIHPTAAVAPSASIGPGTVIMAGAVVNPNARIGCHCILNTRASLDHDSAMDDYSSLGPAATTGGNVTIGSFSAVAIGASIIHRTAVGEHSVVGAGATVTRSIPSHSVAYGTPARVIRSRKPGDRYL